MFASLNISSKKTCQQVTFTEDRGAQISGHDPKRSSERLARTSRLTGGS